MKLLLDQNLSRHLAQPLTAHFPGTCHVTSVGLAGASDDEIWQFARVGGYAIVSKDADFHHMSFLYGAPPKTVWIRLGNCSTEQIRTCLGRNLPVLHAFLEDAESALLVITQTASPSVPNKR